MVQDKAPAYDVLPAYDELPELPAALLRAPPTDNIQDLLSGPPPPPQAYSHDSKSRDEPRLTEEGTGFQGEHLKPPPPSYVETHLKLLECFYGMRKRVEDQDGVFGITNDMILDPSVRDPEQALGLVKQKRWAIFVTRAVDRFEAWWMNVMLPLFGTPDRITTTRHFVAESRNRPFYEHWSSNQSRAHFTGSLMPPLDVLMVWHAYMLNPRVCMEDAMRHGWGAIWVLGMPWQFVEMAIDSATFEYNPQTNFDGCRASFETVTRCAWDNLADRDDKWFFCFSCKHQLSTPYYEGRSTDIQGMNVVAETRRSYTSSDFLISCPTCDCFINHDSFTMFRLRRDINDLHKYHKPLPGCVLSPRTGTPAPQPPNTALRNSLMFLNELMHYTLATRVLVVAVPSTERPASMSHIKAVMEDTMLTDRSLKLFTRSRNMRLNRTEQATVRFMMSRYWGNATGRFGLDLVGAVLRQGSFVEKMHDLGWIHTADTTLPATVARMTTKYTRFIDIMKMYPNRMAVPTLDVDLVWHTHQLRPKSYYSYTTIMTHRFIDHDDKVEEVRLSTAFAWTSRVYAQNFNEVYSECLCWYCEATREGYRASGPSFLTKRGARERANASFYDRARGDKQFLDLVSDQDRTAHLSAHNAVRYQAVADKDRTAHDRQLMDLWLKAQKRAEKHGRPLPKGGPTGFKGPSSTGSSRSAGDLMFYGALYPYAMYPYYMPLYFGYPFYIPAVAACVAGTCAGANGAWGACAGAGAGCGGGGCGTGGCGGGGGCAAAGGGCGGGGGGCGGGGGGGCGGGCGGGGGGGCGGS